MVTSVRRLQSHVTAERHLPPPPKTPTPRHSGKNRSRVIVESPRNLADHTRKQNDGPRPDPPGIASTLKGLFVPPPAPSFTRHHQTFKIKILKFRGLGKESDLTYCVRICGRAHEPTSSWRLHLVRLGREYLGAISLASSLDYTVSIISLSTLQVPSLGPSGP